MSLLEDVKAEREQVTENVRSLAKLMFMEMSETVEAHHTVRPIVAALVGGMTELHFPTWRTDNEKVSAFANISAGLTERSADAAICAFTGSMIFENTDTQRALVLMVQTLDWKEMVVQPYDLIKDKVTWLEPYTVTDFETPLIEISCAN